MVAGRYQRFAVQEAHGHSACYEEWANGIAGDDALISLIEALPPERRQPNLVLAAARFAGAEQAPFCTFRRWLIENWSAVRMVIERRATQTNEVGRCAVLLPVLMALPQPIALIEVGASAGLCLYPDRFSYQYDDRDPIHPTNERGASLLPCATRGSVPFPDKLPSIIWRAGIDLNPLDVRDHEAMRWLETLVWPGQEDRLRRLTAAIGVARRDPPLLVKGDLNAKIEDLIRQAPTNATLVVLHSAVLSYLTPIERRTFTETMRQASCRWLSNEAPGVLETVRDRLLITPRSAPASFVLALDEQPLALTGPHGERLEWLF